MSIEAMERCRLVPIRGFQKAILMLLAYHYNPNTKQCDPSVETLAVESGAYHETVSAALEKLKGRGVISARHRGPMSPAYTIHFEVIEAIGKSRGHFDPKPPEKPAGISTPSPRKNRQMPPGKPANAPGIPRDKPKEPNEPKNDAAAGPPSQAEADRDAPTSDPKSESSPPVAARARGRVLAPSHAHAAGREAMSRDSAAPEASQDMSSNHWEPKGRTMPNDPPAMTPAQFIDSLGPFSEDDKWRARLHEWRGTGGKWDAAWGPAPGQPGCRVPPHLLGGATVARKGAVDPVAAEAKPPPPTAPDPALPLMTFADPPKTPHDLVLGIARRKGVSTIRHNGVTYRLH